MELSFAQCETVMNALPIGYYANRRIDTSLSETESQSYYSPMEDKIVISYPTIAARMEKAAEGINIENAVRSMLYHEVSHAILTKGCHEFPATFANNVVEDERIETVLKDYYMDTNFKQQLLDIHGGKIPKATDADSAFFNAVRFRCAPKPILDRVEKLIRDHAHFNRSTDRWPWYEFSKKIEQLYNDITSAYNKNPQDFNPPKGKQGNQQKSMDTLKMGQGEDKSEGQGENEDNGNGSGNEEENSSQVYIATESLLNPDEIKQMIGASLEKHPPLSGKRQQQLDDFTKTIETIIHNFNKKNSGGSGINAYSGVFNPRTVARKDYRYFERSMPTQGNNRFGTCHLNLFIDSSGSMMCNENLINGILASLSEIERKNRNFTMDVSFIDHNYKDCKTVRDREYTARGGNTIPKDMKERFLKRQLPNTCNYNIVLFDGDAVCNEHLSPTEAQRRFSAFDYKQTTLITDSDNKKYLGKGFHAAKVVVTDRYTDELIEHITKALTIAFG